jgi:hypothetical protein
MALRRGGTPTGKHCHAKALPREGMLGVPLGEVERYGCWVCSLQDSAAHVDFSRAAASGFRPRGNWLAPHGPPLTIEPTRHPIGLPISQ